MKRSPAKQRQKKKRKKKKKKERLWATESSKREGNVFVLLPRRFKPHNK